LFLVKEGVPRDWIKTGTYACHICSAIKNRYTTDTRHYINSLLYFVISVISLGYISYFTICGFHKIW